MQALKKALSFIPSIILSLIYIFHGIEALTSPYAFVEIASSMGMPLGIAKFMIFTLGLISIAIALTVLLTPTAWPLIFAALFPIIPDILRFQMIGRPTYIFISTIILALLVYILQTKKTKEKLDEILNIKREEPEKISLTSVLSSS